MTPYAGVGFGRTFQRPSMTRTCAEMTPSDAFCGTPVARRWILSVSRATVDGMSNVQRDPAEPVEVVKLRELTETERQMLELERSWWKYAGAKETAVREQFDMSATRYYQVLNALIDRPEALEHDPLLVRRLRRLRATRQRQRSARRLGFEL